MKHLFAPKKGRITYFGKASFGRKCNVIVVVDMTDTMPHTTHEYTAKSLPPRQFIAWLGMPFILNLQNMVSEGYTTWHSLE